MKTILVTGGAGYIGSICAAVLIDRGYNVVVLDSLVSGTQTAVPSQAMFCKCDLLNPIGLAEVFHTFNIDAVMHFAALAEVERSVRDPHSFYRTNVEGGANLIEAMKAAKVNDLIFSSTCAVYGQPEGLGLVTEDCPLLPINPYGNSKLIFEGLLKKSGLHHVALRYFNAAGATEERGCRLSSRLIPTLLEVAEQGGLFNVYGSDHLTHDGSCIRDYVHVLDIVDAHLRVLENLDKISGEVFNIGTGVGHSVLEVLEVARRITGRPIPSLTQPRRAGDPARLVAGADKIRNVLGWEPHHSSIENIVAGEWSWRQGDRSWQRTE